MSKVALMCGHGRSTDGTWDCGTSYGGNNEAALMLPITKAAVKYLRASGVTVISDADTNNNKNMIADVAWANKEKVAIYVSIHCDYYKAPSGTLPLYVSAKGKVLATTINNAVVSGMGMKTRGVTKRTDLYELNRTDMPACIFETGSIKADITKLKESDKYGKCIAKGICNYLGVAFKESATPTTTKPYEPTTPYTGALPSITVQNGSKGANAKALQTFLNWCINAKLDVDGIIGEKSVAAIKNYQKQYGLDVDGIFGVKSLAKANEIVNAHKPTTTTPAPQPAPKTTTYRVRKTWADSKSQVGAYKLLANAKKECDKHAGYSVFDDNGKAVYTSKAVASTNAQKLAAKANEFAYSTNTSKAKYPSGSPTAAYKAGLNKAYPNRSSWGKAPKAGASCDVFVGTCVRCAGIDPKFPRGLSFSYLPKSDKFKQVSVNKDTIQNGDIILYERNGGGGHICIYYNGKIKEASHNSFYPKTTDKVSARLSKSGKKWVKVFRAK